MLVLGWTLASFSMIFIGSGAAEIAQQSLHGSSSGPLERHGLNAGLLPMIFNGFGATEFER